MENVPSDDPGFEKHPKGFVEWQKLCQEVRTRCVRIDWDDERNKQKTKEQLAHRFHNFALTASAGNPDQYVQDLSLQTNSKVRLTKRLKEVGHASLDKDGYMTRTAIYKEFVTFGNPAERNYDKTKPFAAEIKQLFDLAYNSYLADALGSYLLTPIKTLARTSLQEIDTVTQQKPNVTSHDIEALLSVTTFDLAQAGLYLKSMGALTLQDVLVIRNMYEWHEYIQSMRQLLQTLRWFAEGGAQTVYQNYIALAKRMTDLVMDRARQQRDQLMSPWKPILELDIDAAGSHLIVAWTHEGVIHETIAEKLIHDSPNIRAGVVPLSVRLNVLSAQEATTQANLVASLVFQEGIIELLPVSVEAFENLVRNGEITDGFTLSAYLLAKLKGLL